MTGKGMAKIYKELDLLYHELSPEFDVPRSEPPKVAQVFEMDLEGNLRKVPELLGGITGFSSEELCRLKLENLVFTDDRERLASALRSLSEGAPIVVIDLELFSEDSGAHPVEVTILPKHIGQGMAGYWGAIRDVKGRKVLEESLERVREEQTRSRMFLSDFVSLLVREIRQPLTEILLTLELMHSGHFGEVNDVQRSRMDQVITAVERAKVILNEAIDSSKDAGRSIELRRDHVDLKAIVVSVVNERAPLMGSKGITHELCLPEGPAQAPIDRKAMVQAIANVLDFTLLNLPNGSNVRLDLEERKNALILTLSDSGPGFPEGEVKHLFERFHTFHNGGDGSFSQGLSLYMAKRIIESHNGRIWCESFPGIGTTILITLPMGAH